MFRNRLKAVIVSRVRQAYIPLNFEVTITRLMVTITREV
jgi:hypothetical protein